MLRTSSPVRVLGQSDARQVMALCEQDAVTNVFVAARVLEGGLDGNRGSLFGYAGPAGLEGVCWSAANVVPVGLAPPMVAPIAERVLKRGKWASSVFGAADQVLALWSHLQETWGPAREVRDNQPVLTITGTGPMVERGVPLDTGVRPARLDELDLVVPAASAMFTEEIGYPPYRGSDRGYRLAVEGLIRQQRTLVRVEDGRVAFKADLGSVALGVAQVQGVWVHPDLRGQGLAVPAMAAVVAHTVRHVAPVVSLYVNDFNAAALATYRRVGFEQTGTFATVLL